MSADKLVILTAEQYDERLTKAAQMGAALALAEFAQQGGASNPVLSVADAAKFLKIGEHALRSFVALKQIPHFKIGRVIKFRRSQLLGWEPPAKTLVDDPAQRIYEKRNNRRGI